MKGVRPVSSVIAAAAVSAENGRSPSPGAGAQRGDCGQPAGERDPGGEFQIGPAFSRDEMHLAAVCWIEDGQEIGDGIFRAGNGKDIDHP